MVTENQAEQMKNKILIDGIIFGVVRTILVIINMYIMRLLFLKYGSVVHWSEVLFLYISYMIFLYLQKYQTHRYKKITNPLFGLEK